MFISQLPKLLGWTSNIFSREVKKKLVIQTESMYIPLSFKTMYHHILIFSFIQSFDQ